MRSLILLALFISIVSSNFGCATMFNGSRAAITVRTEESGAKIYVDEQYIGTGSATVSVAKKGSHSIRVSKEGCNDNSTAITKQFDATSLLGFLLDFGIISMLIVDGAATGAISDIEPKSYVLNPTCSATKAPASVQP